MVMETELQLKKRQRICEILGAKEFKRLVLGLENQKYKFIKKYFPNYLEKAKKRIDKKRDKLLKYCSDEEGKTVRLYAEVAKQELELSLRKSEAPNYHISENYEDTIAYLNWNKKIHVRDLKMNAALIALGIVGMLIPIPTVIPIVLLSMGTLSAIMNFECVNLQNYNISRVELKKEALNRLEKRKRAKAASHSAAYNHIAESAAKKGAPVTLEEAVESAPTPEVRDELLYAVLEEYHRRKKGDEPECKQPQR